MRSRLQEEYLRWTKTTRIIESSATEVLDLLDKNGQLPLRSCNEYRAMDQNALRLFCHVAARYTLPTFELIEYLKTLIRGRSAIEIGSGSGDLGRHLGIPMTDSYCQEIPAVKAYYDKAQQPTITYGRDVEKLEALKAIEKYCPEVVIGAWITNWVDPDLPPRPGSIYGVKEDIIIEQVDQYVHIGSEAIHDQKPILTQYGTTCSKSIDANNFVVSRSNRRDDRIWIWSRNLTVDALNPITSKSKR